MPVPCFSDTDCIQLTFNTILGLQATPIFDPGGAQGGGLECRPEGQSIKIFGDPANVAPGTDQDCQLLRRTTAGDMYAKRPNYEIGLLSNDGVPFNDTGVRTADAINRDVQNLADCARLVILTTQWEFTYSTNTGAFESDGTFFLQLTGGVVATISEGFEISGSESAGPDSKIHSQSKTSIFTVPAGASFHVDAYGVRAVADHNVNNGLLTVASNMVMIDVAPGNMFTIT